MSDLNKILDWYSHLTKESLKELKNYYSDDAFFKDPFNEVRGRDKIELIFEEMFLHLERPQFVFIEKIVQEGQVFVTWDFNFLIKGKKYSIHGSSHLKLNEDMKISYHRDYWDVGEELLLKIPIIKSLYGAFRNKLGKN